MTSMEPCKRHTDLRYGITLLGYNWFWHLLPPTFGACRALISVFEKGKVQEFKIQSQNTDFHLLRTSPLMG